MARKPINHADGGAEEKERKGLWSPEEDERLCTEITRHGVSTWSSVAQLAGLRRSGKSCRLRWMNYLRPDLKKEPISKREEEIIISLHKVLGNRWSVIAARMPGRTDNEIKNYWNSRIRKRRQNINAGVGCTEGDVLPAETFELTPASREKEPIGAATAAPPMTAQFPVFECQLHGGGGGDALAAGTQSTTTHEQNAGSESEVSVGNGGEDAQKHGYCTGNGNGDGNGDSDMIHLLSFDDLEYPAGLFMDVPEILDAWESELYCAKFEEHC